MSFRPLQKSAIDKELLKLAQESTHWEKYHEFDFIPVPHSILDGEPFFKGLPAFYAGIVKMDPYTCYDWHVDGKRRGVINMLLTGFDSSLLLFKASKDEVYFKTSTYSYTPSHYHLFNTQVPHTILNGPETRYLFSTEFLEPVEYKEMESWFEGV